MGHNGKVNRSVQPVAADSSLPRWNLQDFYDSPTDPRIEADLHDVAVEIAAFVARYKGAVAALSGPALAHAIACYEAFYERAMRVRCYADLLFSIEMAAPENGQFIQTIGERLTALFADVLFFTLELNRVPQTVYAAWCQDPALAHYGPWLQQIRMFQPHQREDEVEQLFEAKTSIAQAWLQLFQETSAGLKIQVGDEALSLADAQNRLSNPSREVRERAFKAIAASLEAQESLFALIYNTLAKDKAIDDEWHYYPHPWSSRNLANQVEDDVVAALISAVQESYGRLMHRYYALKAKWLGLPRLELWDRNAPLPQDEDSPIPWARAQEIVLGAYHAFSPALAALAAQFFDKNWIDAAPRRGKDGGAFAHPTVPSVHPYILTNYYGKTRDVMVLAHELGHGVHQCLAAGQGMFLSDTPYTLAETASVFGEMLTFRALLDAQTDPAKKRVILANKVEDMLNTCVRQIGLYGFEVRFHKERRQGAVLPERIGALWLETQQACLGPAMTLDPLYRTYWAAIPHFFGLPFYLYAYAFGDCLVNALYAVYQETPDKAAFVRQYHEMLAAGGRKRHKELLAPFGLDASDPAFWTKGLDVIAGFIDELERT